MKTQRLKAMGPLAHIGWLVTTLALAGTLVVSAWANHRAALRAAATLNAGQAEILSTVLRAAEPPGGNLEGDTAALNGVLRAQSEAGLRYIALLDADGRVVTSVGSTVGSIQMPDEFQGTARFTGELMIPYGDRIRLFTFRRGSPPERPGTGAGQPGAGAEPGQRTFGRGRGGPPMPAYYLLEFEPVPANDVISKAVRSLVLSAMGAGLLTLVALAFWRQSRRYEGEREEVERQRRLSQLGEMSAVLAHEIRNPLASLKGNAQLLAEGLEGGSRERRRADRVVSEAIRLEALTTDLLDFARSGPLRVEEVDPADLLRVAIEEAGGEGTGAVELEMEEVPERWAMDPARLRQALVNLLSNAWQVSPEGRPPRARVAGEGNRLVFSVRDFGPGLDEADRERIFEPFFTTRTNGTGLGLAVARRVVELHEGSLEAENHPEGGAIFKIVLPGKG